MNKAKIDILKIIIYFILFYIAVVSLASICITIYSIVMLFI